MALAMVPLPLGVDAGVTAGLCLPSAGQLALSKGRALTTFQDTSCGYALTIGQPAEDQIS